MRSPRKLRSGVVKRRPLSPERFLNPPKKIGCSKCRYTGCKKCRGYTKKEQARWEAEQKSGIGACVGDDQHAEHGAHGAHGAHTEPEGTNDQNDTVENATREVPGKVENNGEAAQDLASAGEGTSRQEVDIPDASTTSGVKTRTRSGALSATGSRNIAKKRPLTPERFLNPPKKIGCSKCRQAGCRQCRGYTLNEMKRWQEERGGVGEIDASAGPLETGDATHGTGDNERLDKCKDGGLVKALPETQAQALDSKTPAVTKDRSERVEDLTPADMDKPAKDTAVLGEADKLTPLAMRKDELPVPVVCKREPAGGSDMASVMVNKPVVVVPSKVERPRASGERDEAWWNPLDEDVVRRAKGCLHVSYTGMGGLPSCRDKQIQEIGDWLNSCVQNTRGDSLYLSGVPGTGKTMATNAIVRSAVLGMQDSQMAPPVALSINCMRVETAKDVINRIVAGFRTAALQTITGRLGDDPLVRVPETEEGIIMEGTWADLSPEEHLRKIVLHPVMTKEQLAAAAAGKRRRSSVTESDLVKQTGLIFLILDEIDGMLSGRNCEEIMGSLLALASSEGSRLVIIGIANSIDLMQQLTRPGAVFHRFNLKPRNIIFPTYLREQVSQLLQERLDMLPGPVIDPKAIQFCARKIANGTGDMRRALEAAALSIDVAVKDAVNASAVAVENPSTANGGMAVNSTNAANGAATHPVNGCVRRTVGMRQMGMALNKLSGGVGSSNEHVRAIKKLPVPQQLIMCALSAMVGESFKARGIEDRPHGGRDGQPLLGMKMSHNFVSLPTYRAPDIGNANARLVTQLVTLADIEQGQRSLCSSIGVEKYTPSEFSTAIEVLETMGLIQISGKKAPDMKRSRVQLKISEDDVWLALSDIPVLKDILTKK